MRSQRTRYFFTLAPLSCIVLLFTASCRWAESEAAQFKTVRSVAGSERGIGEPFGVAMIGESLYFSDGANGGVFWKSPKSELRIVQTEGLHTPSGIAVDAQRKVLVADSGRHAIYSAELVPVILAGVENGPGFADGETTSARFNGPTGIAVSGDRTLISDTYNDRIRAVHNGRVSSLAGSERGYADGPGASAKFDTPLGLAMWGERLLVADAGNRRIRVVEPDGRVWTLAGNGGDNVVDGFPLQSSFVRPTAIAVGPDGGIYVADGNAIRVIGRRSFAFVETISGGERGFRDGDLRTAQFNRPSGLAFDADGRLFVADSDNGLIRAFDTDPPIENAESIQPRTFTAEEFRALQPPRWPFDPPEAKRDIAGTLGEIRGEIVDENSRVWFHNGLDIAGAYGETARFLRDEKVLNPMSTENFGTLRELLRMPTVGYIHIRLGRDKDNRAFGDPRFIFSKDAAAGKLSDVRIPRGARFTAGEPIGTLNAMNHVHMIAGPTVAEMNALAALTLPGVRDSIPPVIESAAVFDSGWNEIETQPGSPRIKLRGKTRLVVRAFDRMDGNPERRRLGVYRVGYQILNADGSTRSDTDWTITFDRNPPGEAVKTVYAVGSKSGYTGVTAFNYIATNRLKPDSFSEGFIDSATIEPGNYSIRVFAADFFGNQTYKDIPIEVIR